VYVTVLTEWQGPARCIRRSKSGRDRQLLCSCAACAEGEVISVVIASLCVTPWQAGSDHRASLEWMVGD